MCKTQVTIRKSVEGLVEYNDGTFAEIQTNGIEGIEKDLLLDTIQIACCETTYTPKQFKRIFQVGTWLDITTETAFTARESA